MAGSDITVSGLEPFPRVQGNKLEWIVTDPWPPDMSYSLGAVEVWGSTTNDRAGAAKVGGGLTDFLHSGLVEEATWYYWIKARNKVGAGSYGAWYPVSATAGVSSRTLGQAGTNFTLTNGKIVATVAANALTIAIKTAEGNDPSASYPIYVAYQNTDGTYTTLSITSPTSLVISSGSTLKALNSTPFRLWVGLFDNSGTLGLGVKNCVDNSTPILFPLPESSIVSTTAEGGAGAADNAGVFYTNSVLSLKRYRVIGYLDWNSGLATAGAWSSAPDVIQLFAPGNPLPGELIQSYRRYTFGFTNSVASIPYDDTLPQNTEGMPATNAGLTPTSPVNYWINDIEIEVSCSAVGVITLALFRNNENDACAAKAEYMPVADKPVTLTLHDVRQIAATSSQGFTTNVGGESGTIGYNGTSAARKLGGALAWHHTMSELMV